jgi:hypothetical protein
MNNGFERRAGAPGYFENGYFEKPLVVLDLVLVGI